MVSRQIDVCRRGNTRKYRSKIFLISYQRRRVVTELRLPAERIRDLHRNIDVWWVPSQVLLRLPKIIHDKQGSCKRYMNSKNRSIHLSIFSLKNPLSISNHKLAILRSARELFSVAECVQLNSLLFDHQSGCLNMIPCKGILISRAKGSSTQDQQQYRSFHRSITRLGK